MLGQLAAVLSHVLHHRHADGSRQGVSFVVCFVRKYLYANGSGLRSRYFIWEARPAHRHTK